MRPRSDLHLARKIWHFLGVMGLLAVFVTMERQWALKIFALLTIAHVTADGLRLHFTRFNKVVMAVFGPLMRDSEERRISGTSFLLLGVSFVVWFFPPPVVVLVFLFVAVADPLASYFGLKYGKDKLWGQKTLQGCLAAFLACVLISASFFYASGVPLERVLIVSILCGLVGALGESVPIGNLDDNLTFPVFSSICLYLIFQIFGGL